MKPIDMGLIQARRAALEQQIANETAQYQARLKVLEDELAELEVAERVFAKLSKEGRGSATPSANGTEQRPGKPENTPPVPDMILEAVGHAQKLGSPRIKPSGMLSYIQGKWWPTATSVDVGPIAWRMWQRGQLDKHKDGAYCLPVPKEEKV